MTNKQLCHTQKKQFQIIMGDLNAKVGDGNGEACMRKLVHRNRNERRDDFIKFATVMDLKFGNNHFHKNIHKNVDKSQTRNS